MGHREDLLEGAKRCLVEKGFVRTTARDIVKESGTNLASIGYHYGSKDALLAEAYVDLISNVGDTFGAFDEGAATGEPGSLERFEEAWRGVIRSFTEARPIWLLTFEVVTNADRLPTVREHLVKAQDEGAGASSPCSWAVARRTSTTRRCGRSAASTRRCSTDCASSGSSIPTARPRPRDSPRACDA